MPSVPTCPSCDSDLPVPPPPGGKQACPSCGARYVAVVFPAAVAPKRLIEPVPAGDGDATCYHHAAHRAEVACGACGRLLCWVCAVETPAGRSCPSCAVPAKPGQKPSNDRINYVGTGTLALLVMSFLWPLAVVTGPVLIGWMIHGRRQPRGPIPRRRWPFLLIIIIAAIMTFGSAIFWGAAFLT